MTTLSEMIDEVKAKLSGYTINQDRVTYSNLAISATDTTIKLGNGNNLAKGIIEIDDELIWIDSFDKSTNTLYVIPGFGRGYQGTNPAPHPIYSQITLTPTYPRSAIKKAINDTIASVFPKLFVMSAYTFTYNTAVNTYALPDDCEDVFQVTWSSVGPSKEWHYVKRWNLDQMANLTAFNSNNSITIKDNIAAGRTVQVWYRTTPNTLTGNSDVFTDITGLPESAKDVIILGACARLLALIDAGRINVTSAEADAADSKIPSTAATSASKYIYALFQQRLSEEATRLNGKYPIRPHYIR